MGRRQVFARIVEIGIMPSLGVDAADLTLFSVIEHFGLHVGPLQRQLSPIVVQAGAARDSTSPRSNASPPSKEGDLATI